MQAEGQQSKQVHIEAQKLLTVSVVMLKVIALILECIKTLMASRPEELPLRPLTERCVNLSIHTAPIKQTHLPCLSASVRKDTIAPLTVSQETNLPVSYGL